MIKIIIDNAIPYIKGRFSKDVETIYLPGNEITKDSVKEADVIIIRTRTKCNKDLLEGSSVRLVCTATIGTDHIDKEWCEKNGIMVKNAPGCNAPGVAQYVFSSLFKTGFHLSGQVLGIVGFGNVGQIVGDWARKMRIPILVCDPLRKEKGYKDAEYIELIDVLKNSDALTIHVPLTKEGLYPTYRMIGEEQLNLMKNGAIMVNSSRGGVVDETELKKVIETGKIRSIIDVWENEPEIDSELAALAKIATPHIAGYSEEGKKRATRMVLEEISSQLNLPIDLTGLECTPPEDIEISRKLIEESYDPSIDHKNLLENIRSFEQLRNLYHYRHEPLFIQIS